MLPADAVQFAGAMTLANAQKSPAHRLPDIIARVTKITAMTLLVASAAQIVNTAAPATPVTSGNLRLLTAEKPLAMRAFKILGCGRCPLGSGLTAKGWVW